jgi:hypothetical protein
MPALHDLLLHHGDVRGWATECDRAKLQKKEG